MIYKKLSYKVLVLSLTTLFLLAVGCNNSKIMENSSDDLMVQLAQSFKEKDVITINNLISDGYSGMRFSNTWSEENWQAFAHAFTTAKLKSNNGTEAIYEIVIEYPEDMNIQKEIKDVTLVNQNGKWLLVFQTFMITPHE